MSPPPTVTDPLIRVPKPVRRVLHRIFEPALPDRTDRKGLFRLDASAPI